MIGLDELERRMDVHRHDLHIAMTGLKQAHYSSARDGRTVLERARAVEKAANLLDDDKRELIRHIELEAAVDPHPGYQALIDQITADIWFK
jgi:acyl-CoA reductase-like NAD-dependent aldehyde dehydrogenase